MEKVSNISGGQPSLLTPTTSSSISRVTATKNYAAQNNSADQLMSSSENKMLDMSVSPDMGGNILTVSITDRQSGEIFRKIVYAKAAPKISSLGNSSGYLIDISI